MRIGKKSLQPQDRATSIADACVVRLQEVRCKNLMSIQLLFSGDVSEEDVLPLLLAPESGFEADPMVRT